MSRAQMQEDGMRTLPTVTMPGTSGCGLLASRCFVWETGLARAGSGKLAQAHSPPYTHTQRAQASGWLEP